jgi:excisionase family DNA binding protein
MARNYKSPDADKTTPAAASMAASAMRSLIELMTTKEVCEVLKISRDTLYEWREINAGPPAFKLPNGQLRFPVDEFEAWLRRRGLAA